MGACLSAIWGCARHTVWLLCCCGCFRGCFGLLPCWRNEDGGNEAHDEEAGRPDTGGGARPQESADEGTQRLLDEHEAHTDTSDAFRPSPVALPPGKPHEDAALSTLRHRVQRLQDSVTALEGNHAWFAHEPPSTVDMQAYIELKQGLAAQEERRDRARAEWSALSHHTRHTLVRPAALTGRFPALHTVLTSWSDHSRAAADAFLEALDARMTDERVGELVQAVGDTLSELTCAVRAAVAAELAKRAADLMGSLGITPLTDPVSPESVLNTGPVVGVLREGFEAIAAAVATQLSSGALPTLLRSRVSALFDDATDTELSGADTFSAFYLQGAGLRLSLAGMLSRPLLAVGSLPSVRDLPRAEAHELRNYFTNSEYSSRSVTVKLVPLTPPMLEMVKVGSDDGTARLLRNDLSQTVVQVQPWLFAFDPTQV